jgi:negative regulator of sigma-B (phosphoserine phosphatase)
MINQFTFETHTFSAFQKPKNKHKACGDSYWLKETDDEMICVIADGLGSGEQAQLASRAAVETVQQYETHPVMDIVNHVNEEQRNFRGVSFRLLNIIKRLNGLSFVA